MLSLHGGWPTGPQSCPGFLTTVDRLHKHTNSIRKVEEAPGSVVLTRVRFISWPSDKTLDAKNEIIQGNAIEQFEIHFNSYQVH